MLRNEVFGEQLFLLQLLLLGGQAEGGEGALAGGLLCYGRRCGLLDRFVVNDRPRLDADLLSRLLPTQVSEHELGRSGSCIDDAEPRSDDGRLLQG